jgi:hypothetical protein
MIRAPKTLPVAPTPPFPQLTGTWQHSDTERRTPSEHYVQLVTRVPVAPVPDDHRPSCEALSGPYSLFRTARHVMPRGRHAPPRTLTGTDQANDQYILFLSCNAPAFSCGTTQPYWPRPALFRRSRHSGPRAPRAATPLRRDHATVDGASGSARSCLPSRLSVPSRAVSTVHTTNPLGALAWLITATTSS